MTVKEKKSIIIGFSLCSFIFIFFSFLSLFYIYPNILEIEEKKLDLKIKTENYDTLKSKGFSFSKFKKLNKIYGSKISADESIDFDENIYNSLNDSFYKKLYKNLDESLYDNYIYGSSFNSFENSEDSFFKYLKDNIEISSQLKESNEFNEKISNISSVLPKYSNYIDLNSKESISDLEFINSVENMLRKFNLRTTSPIGIKSLIPVDNDVIKPKDHIYYIPLNLDILGTKYGILELLSYIKDSGSITLSENDFQFDSSNSKTQLKEVESLKMDDYIDSSLEKRSPSDYSLKRFLLKTSQNNDIIQAHIKLNFYISGLGLEKIISEVNSIIGNNFTKIRTDKYGNFLKNEDTGEYEKELVHYNHSNLSKIAKKLSGHKKLKKNSYYNQKVNNILLYLNSKDLNKDIKSINKELNKTDDLNKIYLNVLKYKEIFLKIDSEIYSIVNSLGIDKDDIYFKNYIFE